MSYLKKIQQLEHCDITVEPKGKGPEGLAYYVKLEIMEKLKDERLQTVKVVRTVGSGETMEKAERAALKKAAILAGLI